jgi:ribosomal protein S18 acetylase RimI-like enzyme
MLRRYELLTDPDEAEIQQIINLYRTADWWNAEDDANQDLVRRIVSGSHCFLAVKEGDAIVGMGRAISDGVNDAYLQDITVLPRLRHQDVGTRIVEMLVERLHLDGMRWIGLIAGSNSHPFYKKLGFEEMPYSTPMLFTQRTKV